MKLYFYHAVSSNYYIDRDIIIKNSSIHKSKELEKQDGDKWKRNLLFYFIYFYI